ncbi:folate-binding protein YgfZ [Pseudogulbenkiania sp. MAI-1]|uniref:CAF17-like 4Fe-4S cluster assembly/insertion protein YgfZ n=1 Tax=Pseudogulbenkiania sp. MAI-1 TaxID=990370 RepID=UPI0004B32F2E|nr:folate-binding protein YgfZ [Pseudogulbenkiania sp. MAI-1]
MEEDVMSELSSDVSDQYMQQLEALRNGDALCSMSHFAVIRVSGNDAHSFLQGQLSSDLREVSESHSQYSTYSNAKGRVLGNFLIWQFRGDYFLLLSADIAEALCRRLGMFVLRSQVKLQLVTDQWLLAGVKGKRAEEALKAVFNGVPERPHDVIAGESGGVIRLPAGSLLLFYEKPAASAIEQKLASSCYRVDNEAWSLLDIAAGIPWVTAATQEQFVPQMINMDVLGGISFKKGCYPGQEIVARTQYLGKVKRRLFHVELPVEAKPGDALYSPATGEQAIGMVVNVGLEENARLVALAVAQISGWETGLFLEKEHKNALKNLSLPYVVD